MIDWIRQKKSKSGLNLHKPGFDGKVHEFEHPAVSMK